MDLPAIFVSHGAPTLAVAENAFTRAWSELGRTLPRPQRILVVSAHWDTPAPAVSAVAQPRTIHDFHGFPGELYEVRYAAPGAPELAQRVHALLTAAGLPCDIDPTRGLDHGAWVPLRWMYPEADIPVTQLSVQSKRSPSHHWALGQALGTLRSEDVLVIGSGGIVHNLRDLDWMNRAGGGAFGWAKTFNDWIVQRLEARAVDDLLDYRRLAPQPTRAHPTEEHFDPFFVALGAGGPRSRRIELGFDMGSLGMDGYLFGE